MKLNNLHFQITFIVLLISSIVTAQTCNGTTFDFPSLPSTFTYTYSNAGWRTASGAPTTAPTSVGASESVAILKNNSEEVGKNNFKGTLYVQSGITFSGSTPSMGGGRILNEGSIKYSNNPNFNTTLIYNSSNAYFSTNGDFLPGGSTRVYNNGIMEINGNFAIGGSVLVYSFADSSILITGSTTLNSSFYNCGYLEVMGSLTTAGSSTLVNDCSAYIHGDVEMKNDYTNASFLMIDGTISAAGANFYNNGILLVDSLDFPDKLVGNNDTSVLIVRNYSKLTSGGSVTGHYYFDMDDGGGIDSVCSGCTEEIDILLDVDVPTLISELISNCGDEINPESPVPSATLDFDGIDDYVTTTGFINNSSEVTLMAWVKSDTGNSTTMTIAGEDTGFRLYLANGNRPTLAASTTGLTTSTISSSAINLNEWHHIAGTFNKTAGIIKLYVDGELKNSSTTGTPGLAIKTSGQTNGSFEIGRRSSNIANKEYFKGDIDEVRAFKTELTAGQIQQMVYQEIVNNGNNVRGTIIGKDVIDIATSKKVSWANLTAYYPMTDIVSLTRTIDYSNYNRMTFLKNISSVQVQTAPMPFTTKTDGNWTSQNTWTNGSVWDIDDTNTNKDWSIVKIDHNVSTIDSHSTLGLIIADGKTLTVKNDNLIANTWYLELNGTIDLNNDSQLIQGINSDLVSSANGKIARRQEGATNKFHYNYWSSPVGSTSANALGNDNSTSNNVNNKNFNLGMLKDGNGNAMQFTSANDAVGKISTRWTYKFQNGVTYYDWTSLNSGTAIAPGVGYIHKGTGSNGNSQQYIFEGKPNNGTIKVSVSDVGGAGSIPNVSQTSTLFGNPYASAMDLHKFIDDNVGVISGTIRLWQQWSGNSHNLSEYDGGYAEVNKLGSVKAFQFEGIAGTITAAQNGTLKATRYLPVGQGFVAEVISNGTVEFNNGQRIFVKEADANNTYNQGSVFFRTRGTDEADATADENIMSKIRLEFNNVDGPKAKRELLMGFSSITTDAYDYGYDSKSSDIKTDDLSLAFNDESMTMQAYSEIKATKEVALNFTASGNHSYTITATEFENLDSDQEVYLRDNLTGDYFDLIKGKDYSFSSEAGTFNERFTIVFQSEESALTLDTEEVMPYLPEHKIYYNASSEKLFVKELETDVKHMAIVNMLGQVTNNFANVSTSTLNEGITLSNLNTGVYIVSIQTNDNKMIDKKFMIN